MSSPANPNEITDAAATAPRLPTAFRSDEREERVRQKTRGSVSRLERSRQSLAGGVSSGLRRTFRPNPLFFDRGRGSRVIDVDQNVYLDYGLAWGPLILGHAPPEVVEAVQYQLSKGFTFGAQHDLEFEVAERLTNIIPCGDSVCFANSGTEIVQLALRLTRAVTGRKKLVKFEGHYHGWADNVFVSYHPTAEEVANSDGNPIPAALGQLPDDEVLIAQWNDCAGVEKMFANHGAAIASVICEPMLCNSGCIPPDTGFLEMLREITRSHGALLIFDEVITGFRLHLKGAQGLYGVEPDLATYAKAIGAGTPLSALAGKAEFMALIASGQVVHAGTLNGNPIALAAARAALDVLARENGAVYESLWSRGERLRLGLEAILSARGYPVVTTGAGPVFQLSFMSRVPHNYRDTLEADRSLYSDFAVAMLDAGVLLLPDGRWYLSIAHTDADIEDTLAAAERVADCSASGM